AIKDTGAVAGLQIRRIINKPTAATIAHGLDKESKSESLLHVLLFSYYLLIFSGGHVTVDFYMQARVRVTTHHMCPTEAAYGDLGNPQPGNLIPPPSSPHVPFCRVTVATMIGVAWPVVAEYLGSGRGTLIGAS
ncbi:hypothetical protein BJY52DRAFT_1232763, partial [Lactarius psammicola]